MSLYCAISGQPPLKPVLSVKSGVVYESDLITKYLNENGGKDPITGDELTQDDLVQIKTAPSSPSAPPRAPSFTSVPSILHTLQNEWDACMLECLELRRQGDELRQELSHALYKEDAAMRVLARLTRERDEARNALASVQQTLGLRSSSSNNNEELAATAATSGQDVDMDAGASTSESAGLPADAKQRVDDTNKSLSATRKKRKTPQGYTTVDDVKSYAQTQTVPSLHTTKPPGISAFDVVSDASSFVTGGNDKAVQLYNRSTGKIIATLKGHTKQVTAVLASAHQTQDDAAIPAHLISASLDKSVRVWVPSGKKAVYEVAANLSTDGEVHGLALHPSQTLVASCSSDGSWSIHDLQPEGASKPATVLTGSLTEAGDIGATSIAFHPDGAIFAVGATDSRVRVFDTKSGACVATFDGHSAEQGAGQITSLSFSENGYTLASAAQASRQIKLWDLRKLTNSANIPLDADADASVTVNVVRFDKSAQFLAVAGTDLRVFGYHSKDKSWSLLVRNEDNAGELTGAGWSDDGKVLLVAGQDRTVRVLSKADEGEGEATA